MSRVIECDEDSFFGRTLDASKKFVVDFTASWCAPCREMAPYFDELSVKYPYLTFLKVDIDKCPNGAAKYEIRSVPSFVFLEGPSRIDYVGGMDREQLKDKCAKHGTPVKGEPVEHDLVCSLEELFVGLTKKIKIVRKRRQMDGHLYDNEKLLEVPVKAGWKAGTKITFAGEGDEEGMKLASDIIFVVKEKEHERYTREGNNLVYSFDVPLKEVLLNGIQMSVPLFDGQSVHEFKADRDPKYMIDDFVLPGEGMPISKYPGTRGDLIIRPNITMPSKQTIDALTEDQRDSLAELLCC